MSVIYLSLMLSLAVGHEVETRFWAKLEPEALEMVVDAATEVLHEVFES